MKYLTLLLFVSLLMKSQSAPAAQFSAIASALGVGLSGASLGLQASSFGQDQNRGAITLYQHSNHGGERVTTTVYRGLCSNILNFNDRTSSVHTRNECYILWEHANCQGRYHMVAPGTGCHYNLQTCGFNDMASSIQRCNF